MRKFLFLACFIVFYSSFAYSKTTSTQVCFTPYQDCESLFVSTIDSAKSTLDVQEYHLTNRDIVASVLRAKERGVDVRVILDKTAKKEAIPFLNDNIPVLIDYKPRIAHNKIMIVDGHIVIGGSFNPTQNAMRNAENLRIDDDARIAGLYEENLMERLSVSKKIILGR